MPETSKLGRNPLEKLQEQDRHDEFALPGAADGTSKEPSALEKIREMQIQVDWPELYENTVAVGIRKLAEFLKKT